MKFAVVRLAVAAVLFVGWIGYLSFLAATTRNPVVLSRPQFLISQRDVIATYQGGDKFRVDEVLYPQGAPESEKGKTLIVGDLKDCQTFSPENGWQWVKDHPLAEGQQYLLPLQTAAGPPPAGAAPPDAMMDVVPIPPSPGFPPSSAVAGPPRIYPATPEVRRQYAPIPKS